MNKQLGCFLAMIALAVAVPDLKQVKSVCSPRAKFMDQCNHCVCDDDGTAATCTTLDCGIFNPDGSIKLPSEILGNPLLRTVGLREEKKVCEPNKAFQVECNTCVCSDDGTGFACTRMNCSPFNKDGSIKLPSEILNNPLLRSAAKSQVCEPSKTYHRECNTCHCAKDGTHYSCTQMLCEPEESKVCTPRSSFYKQCNMCHCNDDGTGALCTKMSCDLFKADGSLKLPSEILNNPLLRTNSKVCQPMTRFTKDCNSCICNEDGTGAACTFLACDNIFKEDGSIKLPSEILKNPLLRSNRPESMATDSDEWGPLYVQGTPCTPLSHFKSQCNDCVCASNGLDASCTFRYCQAEEV